MVSKNVKRGLLIYFDLIFSMFIWDINQNIFGNTIWICFILSTTTFLIIYTPFEIYWSFRDIWFDRWIPVHLKDLNISKVKIEVRRSKKGKIYALTALMITPSDKKTIKSKNTIIIICHGFSDTKETLQFYYYPLVYQGFTILTYDARGTGDSKKTGKRTHFVQRIEDYKAIIKWIRNQHELKNKRIYSVGFSIGALTVLCGGFMEKNIEKIIAISAMSNYKQNLPKFNPIVILRYIFKGVKLFPKESENEKLSPYIIIEKIKKSTPEEDWEKLSNRILLIHSRNDRIIKIKNFEENTKLMNLQENNKLLLRKGGHTQKKNELILVGASLKFFNS